MSNSAISTPPISTAVTTSVTDAGATAPARATGVRAAAARVTGLVAVLALLAVPSWTTSTARAAEPPPVSGHVTDQDTGTFPLSGPLPAACIKTDPVRLSGTYTYGQRFGGTFSHDQVGMRVPDGTYTLHDCVDDFPEDGLRMRSSWLDPAPDPHDQSSGVIVTVEPLTGPDAIPTPGPTSWGSWLTAEP